MNHWPRRDLSRLFSVSYSVDSAEPPIRAAKVRALPGIAEPDQRAARGAELASQGFSIDVPIMVWAWDPYLVMKMRWEYGYTWVPSALQPAVTIAPGIGVPGPVPYDAAHPPSGSIHVSTNSQDYPP